MATLIPDQPKECPYGERIVYEKLREAAQRVNAHFDARGLVGAK